MFHPGRRIDQFAGHADAPAFLLQLHAEVRRVGRVFLLLTERGRRVVEEVDRRIVRRDELDRASIP